MSQIYSGSTTEKYHVLIYLLLKKNNESKVITSNSDVKAKTWTYAKNNWEKMNSKFYQ